MLAALLGALSLFVVVPAAAQITVTLSASPNPVDEGSPVTMQLDFSATLTNDVVIPVTISDDTAEPADHGTLTSITAARNLSLARALITTNHDADDQDEMFTVALDTANLPSGYAAGTPSSVQITIRDDERVLTGHTVTLTADNLRPTEGSTVTLTATLNPAAPAGGATLHFIKAEGTAIGPGDYTLSPPGSFSSVTADITINEGETMFTAMLKVNDDTEGENDETIVIGVGRSSSSLTLTNRPRLTLTIPRNDGGTTTTPTPDPPSMPPPPAPTPPTSGGPPPAAPSDPDPDSPRCGETDMEDLERFYEASGGDNWHDNENWNSAEPLDQWDGVETDKDGNVVSLLLPDNNLSGDMPTEELLCLTELVELALWGNDLSGEIPDKFTLPVERAVLRDIAEMLNLYPQWFEDYEGPYDFRDWHTGVITDDGRVTELDLTGEEITGEIPQSVFELQRLRAIETGCGVTLEGEAPERVSVTMPDDCAEETVSSGDGGCALSPKDDSSAFSLFLLTLVAFAALGRRRVRG